MMKLVEKQSRPAATAPKPSKERRIVILGSTGSIGVNALNVIDHLGARARVVGLTAYGNTEKLLDQVQKFSPEVVAVWDEESARAIRQKGLRVRGKPLQVLSG